MLGKCVNDFGGSLVSAIGVACHQFLDDLDQPKWRLGLQIKDAAGLLLSELIQNLQRCGAFKRRPSCDTSVQDCTQSVDVAPEVNLLSHCLFG